ncbi:MAG: DUF4298 domain-containing protein [Clostridia bacterium]|nr:DUF4298 domain-containing protein [Clostridia bacterium]
MERMERIQQMEEKLDTAAAAVQALEKALALYKKAPLQEVFDYYFSPQWREDFEANERGELPPNLKRGVLAEDTVYDLFTQNRALLEELRSLLPSKEEET